MTAARNVGKEMSVWGMRTPAPPVPVTNRVVTVTEPVDEAPVRPPQSKHQIPMIEVIGYSLLFLFIAVAAFGVFDLMLPWSH